MEGESDWISSGILVRGRYFLISGLKGFGEEDKFSHSVSCPQIFVQEEYITFLLEVKGK